MCAQEMMDGQLSLLDVVTPEN